MKFAVGTREALKQHGIRARVISFPCQRLFERQSKEYKRSILGSAPRFVIEAYSQIGWEGYGDAGYHMHTFGQSLTGNVVYDRFNFNNEKIASKVKVFLEDVKQNGYESIRGLYQDYNDYEEGVQFAAYHKK